jgi:hypothetical protein
MVEPSETAQSSKLKARVGGRVVSRVDGDHAAEGCVGTFGVWMFQVVAAECDDMAVAADRRFLILMAMLFDVTFHQPCLGKVGIDLENSVQKDLCNVPSFFRNGACCVTPIHTYHAALIVEVVVGVR